MPSHSLSQFYTDIKVLFPHRYCITAESFSYFASLLSLGLFFLSPHFSLSLPPLFFMLVYVDLHSAILHWGWEWNKPFSLPFSLWCVCLCVHIPRLCSLKNTSSRSCPNNLLRKSKQGTHMRAQGPTTAGFLLVFREQSNYWLKVNVARSSYDCIPNGTWSRYRALLLTRARRAE